MIISFIGECVWIAIQAAVGLIFIFGIVVTIIIIGLLIAKAKDEIYNMTVTQVEGEKDE